MDNSTRWRKSSRSGSGDACIEIRNDLQSVRDSKNPLGQLLHVEGIRRLIETAKKR